MSIYFSIIYLYCKNVWVGEGVRVVMSGGRGMVNI